MNEFKKRGEEEGKGVNKNIVMIPETQ